MPSPLAQKVIDDRTSLAVEAQQAAYRLAQGFREVFGDQNRSDSQVLVMEHLKAHSSDNGNSFTFDGKDGLSMIAAGLHRDGARSVIRVIERQLQIARESAAKKRK